MQIEDGGPAFPSRTESERVFEVGMSLRDWLAGQALSGMIAGSQGLRITTEEFAVESYKLADAMLKARKP